MGPRIAIQPDKVIHRNGEVQSFSERWYELARAAGLDAEFVDVYTPDFLQRLHHFDGFMWRFDYAAMPRVFAKRLFSALEHARDLTIYPDWKTAWHFEDKISQHYLLAAADFPEPDTWVFWSHDAARNFCANATYPLVMKLAFGYRSGNVKLLSSVDEANFWIDQMFGDGVTALDRHPSPTPLHEGVRRSRAAASRLLNRRYYPELATCELQQGYFYVQEFLPGNEFDTRITVIGDRAFGFRRFNRPGDFRASGSGRFHWEPEEIDLDSVRLAFRVARKLKTQSVAIDVLRKGDTRVVNELSYTFASWCVRECPGHWVSHGNSEDAPLEWVAGKSRPEDAIFEDFISLLDGRSRQRRRPPSSSAAD